jgi:hypothetical protein
MVESECHARQQVVVVALVVLAVVRLQCLDAIYSVNR